MGNMREISIEECNAVFGGTDEPDEIVVTGGKKVKSSSDGGGSGFAWVSLLSGGGGGGGGGGGYVDLASLLSDFFDVEDGEVDEGDDDGDGILNRDEEIVVTADITHDQIKAINELAAYLQWGQNLAFALVVGKHLMGSSLTQGGQLVAGTAIAGATSAPIVDNAHYQANWNYLYWSQVSANKGYTTENGMTYYP